MVDLDVGWDDMKKIVLTQDQVDKLVVVDRVIVEPTVSGVGCVDVPFQTCINGHRLWQHDLWRGLLERCFCGKFKGRNPTYINVTCCDEWFSFANFLEWVNKEVEYKGKPVGMQLDKDILYKGNLMYSPDRCCLVPRVVNLLLNDKARGRGRWPLGVYFDNNKRKFVSQVKCHGKTRLVGLFDTPEDAFQAYKVAKEAQIKVVALEHRDVLKSAVFESLMHWKID